MTAKRWMALFAASLILGGFLFLYLGRQKGSYPAEEEEVHLAEVLFDIASVEDRVIEMEMDIRYYRTGDPSKHLVLSPDEAGDRAFGTVLIAYRTAASKIPFSELITEEGENLLTEKAWEEIKYFNNPSFEPVKIASVNIKEMTPDPDAESVGHPSMLFLDEESEDAEADI